MDTSETYIKQCEKATEIQALKQADSPLENKWDTGDVCYVPHDDTSIDCSYYKGAKTIWNGLLPNAGYHDWDSNWCSPPNDAFWLPRQDQLQEMVGYNQVAVVDGKWYGGGNLHLINNFFKWLKNDEWSALASMEQLWLAFVMKEKYNKVWNGKDWVKER